MTILYEEFIKKLSKNIALESGRDQEVIAFGLRIFFSSVLGYVLLIVVSLLLGIFKYTIAAALTTSIFRIFSGGAHASSQLRCCLSGILIFIPVGFLAKVLSLKFSGSYLIYIIIFIVIYGLIIIYKYVPADTPGKPISSQIQKKYLRAVSFLLLVFWTIAAVYFIKYQIHKEILISSILGLFWQLITLTSSGYKFVERCDFILIKLGNLCKGGE
jgi:accessory gene regulator B